VSCSDGMDFRRFFGDGWFLAGSGGCRVVICERGEGIDFVDRESNLGSLFSFKKSEVYLVLNKIWKKGEYSFIHSLFIVDYYQ